MTSWSTFLVVTNYLRSVVLLVIARYLDNETRCQSNDSKSLSSHPAETTVETDAAIGTSLPPYTERPRLHPSTDLYSERFPSIKRCLIWRVPVDWGDWKAVFLELKEQADSNTRDSRPAVNTMASCSVTTTIRNKSPSLKNISIKSCSYQVNIWVLESVSYAQSPSLSTKSEVWCFILTPIERRLVRVLHVFCSASHESSRMVINPLETTTK